MNAKNTPEMNVYIVATLCARKGKEQGLLKALRELVSASQAEPGCIEYILHGEVMQSGTFVIYETWISQSDLDKHMGTPHFVSFVAASESLLSAPAHIRVLERI